MTGESVVYVEALAGKTFPAPTQQPVIDQKGLMFLPHIMVVQQGTTVEFLNSDSVAHNVFWTSVGGNKKLGHNLGTWPKGEKQSFKFDNPGVVPLLCNVHPEMSGYVIVSPTPYFAETDKSGEYKIENVPDGSYTVTAWHEGAKNQVQASESCWRHAQRISPSASRETVGAGGHVRSPPSSECFPSSSALGTAIYAATVIRQEGGQGLVEHQLSLHDGLSRAHQRGPLCRADRGRSI